MSLAAVIPSRNSVLFQTAKTSRRHCQVCSVRPSPVTDQNSLPQRLQLDNKIAKQFKSDCFGRVWGKGQFFLSKPDAFQIRMAAANRVELSDIKFRLLIGKCRPILVHSPIKNPALLRKCDQVVSALNQQRCDRDRFGPFGTSQGQSDQSGLQTAIVNAIPTQCSCGRVQNQLG